MAPARRSKVLSLVPAGEKFAKLAGRTAESCLICRPEDSDKKRGRLTATTLKTLPRMVAAPESHEAIFCDYFCHAHQHGNVHCPRDPVSSGL